MKNNSNIIARFKERLSELDMDFNEEIFKALTRSSAVAILSADAKFIDVNENFAKIFGYTEEELVGKKHADFLTQEYKDTGKYTSFWNELRSGRFVAGEFERKNRLGATVWINGSYNSILNEQGELVFVVKFAVDITEQKNLSLDLEQQQKSINNSYSIVHFDLERNILFANESFCKLLSYESEELVNTNHSKLVFEEDLDDSYHFFWNSLKSGISMPGEFRRKTRLGKEVWIRGSYNPVFDDKGKVYKIIKYAIDVTKEKIVYNNYKSQLDAINRSNAIIEFSTDGYIQLVNDNFLDIVGYTKDEILGKHHSIFLTEEEKGSDSYKNFWDSLRVGEFLTGEFKRVNRTGREVWIRGSYNPVLDSKGKVIKVIKYALDVTQHKKAQETLMKDQEIIHSQSKMAALGQMAAGIAHEINNPLASIMTLVEEANLTGNKDQTLDYLKEINQQAARIQSIIKSLKALVQNDNESTQYHNLIDIIQAAFKLAQNTLITNQIDVHFELSPLQVYGNKTNLIQIIVNLINNSIYVLKKKGKDRLITVKCFEHGFHGYLQFSDNGPGIPFNIEEDIFNPFFTTKGPEGTGLGLALAKQSLKQIKGDIYINRKVSNSCFEIKLHTNKVNKDAA